MPARGMASNRQTAVNRQLAVGRIAASNRQYVDGGGGGGGDDMVFLEEQVVGVGGAASVTFSAISQAYRHLMILWTARSAATTSARNLRLQANGDTGSNYDMEQLNLFDTTVSASEENGAVSARVGNFAGSDALANASGSGIIWLPYYSATIYFKNFICDSGRVDSTSVVGRNAHEGNWRNTAAITSLVLFPDTGNFAANSSFSLYGIT